MSQHSLPEKPELPFAWAHEPDPMSHPELFDGIVLRRILAYLIDAVIIFGAVAFLWFLGLMTLGLLLPIVVLLTSVIPIAYHTMLIGGPNSATVGMRLMGIEVRRLDGGRPELVQALLQALLFYATLAFTGLLLLVALFNDRRRCLHDWLSGTITVNATQ